MYFHRGKIKQTLHDYKGSIADFTKAIKFTPDAGTYYLRGISKYILDDYTGAMHDFDSTILYDPDISYELYFYRGNIKFKLHDYSGSIVEYTKSINMQPGYAKAYFNRGVSKYYTDQKADVCADIKKAKELGFTDDNAAIRKYCDYYTH
jgi:tetratricopeptide (TPR) repeat protein